MKHEEILRQLITDAESDANTLGFLLFGSVANGTQREDSDIDVITILRTNKPASGVNNTIIDGIKVGDIFLTYEVLIHSVDTVPYLLHPTGNAKLLFDRAGLIEPLLNRIREYYARHQGIEAEWNVFYKQNKEEKATFGYEQTTIVDVWNELEQRHSNGKTKRRFFNAFYLSNARIFSVVKKFL